MVDAMKFLRPRQGLIVRDPSSFIPLPAEGAEVEWIGKAGRYWRRRVNCGDCTEGKSRTINTDVKKRKE